MTAGADYGQPDRRLQNDDEERVKQTLTFLKMQHYEAAFLPLQKALSTALPEFGELSFIDEGGYKFRPAFVLSTESEELQLTREAIGSGSWSFLSILTAARAAKATGASTLVLDEPHLYLHPALERRLVRELTRPELWDGEPLQLLVSTHSPVFLDAGWMQGRVNILDWEDAERTSVQVLPIGAGNDDGANRLISPISDLVYADRVVYVEGPSDALALSKLVGSCDDEGLRLRFEPLCEPDAIKRKAFIQLIRTLARGAARQELSFPGVIVLDADKKHECETEWDKWDQAEDPRQAFDVVFAGQAGHDLESAFFEEGFLCEYFSGLLPLADSSVLQRVATEVREHVTAVKSDRNPASRAKAATRLGKLHESLLGAHASQPTKADYLTSLVDYYLNNQASPEAASVTLRLRPIVDAIMGVGKTEVA